MRPAEAERVGAADVTLRGEIDELLAHRGEVAHLLLHLDDAMAERDRERAVGVAAVAPLGDIHDVLHLAERETEPARATKEMDPLDGVLAEEPITVLAPGDGAEQSGVGVEPDSARRHVGLLRDGADPQQDFALKRHARMLRRERARHPALIAPKDASCAGGSAPVGYLVGFGSALGCTVEPEQHAPQQLPQLHAMTTTSQLI
jgi:hypothetical protein